MYAKNIHYTEENFENIQCNYNGKAEYSNGYIILSSNTSIKHNKIISRLNYKLMTFFDKSKCDVYTESIEVIFRNNEEVYKYKPDVFVMCEKAHRQGESFISSPKIIFEVISKSTASHDYITKLDVYQRFGVLEYNLVEQEGYIVQYSLIDNQYKITNVFKNNDKYTSTVFKDLNISLEDIF
ncbi:Uma2 family endonuclease [Haloimpatiens sp. FM7315]|uniref:Uma2 family endonuclease n=1 Tax=Haloimpatiens sp. FM7315 TaxID=3298609 RepID=UPI0035A2B3A2